MEDKLMARIDAEPAQLPRPQRYRWPRWGGAVVGTAAALAAAAALMLYRAPAPVAPGGPVAQETARGVIPAVLRDHVRTASDARSFSKDGLATWTLEANSEADVADEGERVTVHLTRGAIRVEVVPQPVRERFVVIADGTRVAVRGTRFRVARAESVQVDVERGVVAVGALESEPTFVLKAPAGGTFALQGGVGELRSLVPFSERKAALAPPEPRLAPLPSATTKALEPKPSKGLDEAALRARATAAATECFQKNARPATNVHVTVTTSLRLVMDANGNVSGTFDPPLAPAVEACFRDAMGQLRGAPGTLDLPLSLVGRQ